MIPPIFGSSIVYAFNEEQQRLYRQGINYYDLEATCETTETSANGASNLAPGTGAADGAQFPNLPPAAMAQAIDSYIEKNKPNSKMTGLGETIVASAENSNVSPFLIVAIAHQESSLADPNDFNVRRGNNAFGRTATTSQPNFQGSRLWYKWDSVKASVDHTHPKNKSASGGGDIAAYIRNVYADSLSKDDLVGLFLKYAPPGDGNDTDGYIENVKQRVDEMVKLTNDNSNTGSTTATTTIEATPAEQSVAASGGSVYMLGDSITVGAKDDLTKQFDNTGRTNSYINGSVSRSITGAGVTNGFKTSGLEAIEGDKDKPQLKNAGAIVVALGTNPNNNFEASMRNLIEKIREANSNANLFWVNIFSTGGNTKADEYNPIIEKLSTSLPDNQQFTVIDTQGQGIQLSSDNIHPNQAGSKKFAEVVANSLSVNQENTQTASESSSCECSSDQQGEDGATGSTSLRGRDNVEKAFNFFIDQGLKDFQSAGIVGNLIAESGVNPRNLQDPAGEGDTPSDGQGFGIAQWTFTARQAPLVEFAKSRNEKASDLGIQLEYLWKELNGDPPANDFSKVLADLKKSTSLEEATRIILIDFEAPKVPNLSERLNLAKNEVLEKFGSGSASSSGESIPTDGCGSGTNSNGTGTTKGSFIWPLTKEFAVSSCFGQRNGKLHTGIDIAAPRGTPIVASDGGLVESAEDRGDGFGNSVIIKHSNGKWTLYAHLNTIDTKKGDNVDQGQNIGTVNNTGSSRGDHLHFNIQNSGGAAQDPQDPLKYLPRDGRGVSGTNCPASLG